MIRSRLFTVSLVLAAAMPGIATAQDRLMVVRPESRVMLEGSSNVVDWACRTNAFEATISVDRALDPVSPVSSAKSATRVAVRIPVQSLNCGRKRMNQDLYRTLRAEEFPDIRYVLTSYTVRPTTDASTFEAMTVGDITVAGVTRRVEVPVTAVRWEGGARGRGTVKLRMTDFGVKPPVALFGAIRTKNEIEVTFEVLVDRAVMVALTHGAGRTALE